MAEKSDHQAITLPRGGGEGVDAGAKDAIGEEKGEECQQVVTGWETVEFEDTEGTEKPEGGGEAKLQCKSSDSDSDSKSDSASKSNSDSKSDSASKSDSDSKSDSASDSASKSGSDSGTITLKGKKRTKKTKGKGLKEKIKEKLSGKKSNEGVEVKDVKGGVKAEKLSQLLGKLQCDSSDSDSKSGSDSDSKSGSGNDSNTLKDERSNRARKKGLLKEKLNRKMEEKEKKIILHAGLVASEDEARETKKIEEGEEDKASLPNQLHCDSSHSGSDSGSSSDKGESKGQGEKAKKMKDSKGGIKEKLGIQSTDKEDEKATMVGHEAEKETTVVGESTTAVAEKEGDVQGSKEKKGILEKIMEKLPSYRKNNEDEGEKKVVAN